MRGRYEDEVATIIISMDETIQPEKVQTILATREEVSQSPIFLARRYIEIPARAK